MDNESGEPDSDSDYSGLSQDGYAGLALDGVDVEDCDSLKFLCNLVFPQNDIVNKAHPDCLKITRIIQQCKWGISNKLAKNVFAKEDKGASKSPYRSGNRRVRNKVGWNGPGHLQTERVSSEKDLCPN